MAKIELVTPAWLAEHLGDPDLVVLDGSYYLPAHKRDAEAEYLASHIPGAIRFDIDAVKDTGSPLPHMLPEPDEFAAAVGLMGIDEGSTVVAYDGMGIFAAPRVAWTFRTFGARRVMVLDGGFPAWQAAGFPVESGSPEPREPRDFDARFDDAAVAGLADMRATLEHGSAQVLDARSAARFTGEEPEPRAGMRSGHMPGATNLHYGALLSGGRMADVATIEAALLAAGVSPDRPIVTTCGSGVTAAILLLAIEQTGRPSLRRCTTGSWSEMGIAQRYAGRDRSGEKLTPPGYNSNDRLAGGTPVRRASRACTDVVECFETVCRRSFPQHHARGEAWLEGSSPQCRIWLRNSLVRSCCGFLKNSSGRFISTIWPASMKMTRFAHLTGEAHLVGDAQHRHALLGEAHHGVEHLLHHLGVERRCGLVEQHDLR